jgi:hypothetical protein
VGEDDKQRGLEIAAPIRPVNAQKPPDYLAPRVKNKAIPTTGLTLAIRTWMLGFDLEKLEQAWITFENARN